MIKAVAALANQWLCIYMFMELTQAAGAASCLLWVFQQSHFKRVCGIRLFCNVLNTYFSNK